MDDRDEIAAQDAAEALIAVGWSVLPAGDDTELRAISDLLLTDAELIGLATRRGLRPTDEKGH